MSKQRSFAGRALRVAAVSGFVFATFAPAVAHAASYPDGGGTSTPSDPGSQVQAGTATKSETLPFTGGDVAGLALIGAGAVGAGLVAVKASKRRATA